MTSEMHDFIEEAVESILAFGGFGSVVSLIGYVVSALCLYTIAERRGISKPWLAWIPAVNLWILGSISDQYRYVVRGEVKSKRKILLALHIVQAVLSLVALVSVFRGVMDAINVSIKGAGSFVPTMNLLSGILDGALWMLFAMIVGIAGLVAEVMALHDLYTSCDPQNYVLYLVLSLIPGVCEVTRPLFLFLCREKDEGMPPRLSSPERETHRGYEANSSWEDES